MHRSTIALSLYNALAAHFPRGGELGQIAMAVANAGGTPFSAKEAGAAMAELLDRGLVVEIGRRGRRRILAVRDPLRRVVRNRNRSGDGWASWILFDPTGRVVPVTDAHGKGALKC